MRDEELMSLVLGVILIGVLMAGGVWAFMHWGTPPEDPYAGKGQRHGRPQSAGGHHLEGPSAADAHAPAAHPRALEATGGHPPPTTRATHSESGHGLHAHGEAATAAAGGKTPVWPVKPRKPRPTRHPEGH
jgi:hypothetical protein